MPDMHSFPLPVRIMDGCAIVVVPGDVDVTNASAVRDTLLALLNRGVPGVVIDMTRTRFCDAAGMHAVVRAGNRAEVLRAWLRLVIPHPAARQVFTLTGTDELVPIYASVDHALARQAKDSGRTLAAPAVNAEVNVPGSAASQGPLVGVQHRTAGQLEAVRREFDAQALRFQENMIRLQATREQILKGRSSREILHDSQFARLQAKLASLPVIEQAKGILIAQQRCEPDEAFDLLRRASQRANVKVNVLAAQIVQSASTKHSTA